MLPLIIIPFKLLEGTMERLGLLAVVVVILAAMTKRPLKREPLKSSQVKNQ
jgi:hypothetical protein